MMKTIQIAPSILAADFSCVAKELKRVEEAQADSLHVDIMDGHFVPNLSFGPAFVAMLRQQTSLFLDVHLMIEQPHRYAQAFIEAGADSLIVHVEANHDVEQTLRMIRELGCRPGLALNPSTLFEESMAFLEKIDVLLCMTVNPGFGGQAFMTSVLSKVTDAQMYREAHGLDYDIEVDGGLNQDTVGPSIAAGANIIVAGTSLFQEKEMGAAIRKMRFHSPKE